uniref:Uncharacterized protein n=1 Tax=Glossina pallidipes TaxID=7398 RepID=A0A1A9ZEG3_GLOPL
MKPIIESVELMQAFCADYSQALKKEFLCVSNPSQFLEVFKHFQEANQVFSCEEITLQKMYAQHRPVHSHPHSLAADNQQTYRFRFYYRPSKSPLNREITLNEHSPLGKSLQLHNIGSSMVRAKYIASLPNSLASTKR